MPRKAPTFNPQPVRLARYNGREIATSSAKQGYDAVWRRVRKLHLHRHPVCQHVDDKGRMCCSGDRPQVDHRIPFKGKGDPLRLDMNNLQTLCITHHAQKTRRDNRRRP